MSKRESELILDEISTQVQADIPTWVSDASIQSVSPEIVTRPWSFMLRYPLDVGGAVLVKVARHEDMTLARSVSEKALLKRTEREFEMLSKIAQVFQAQNGSQEFCFVRPLDILPRWNALAMEELDAQPLKNYLLKPQIAFSSPKDWGVFENLLVQSARWLRIYHQGMGSLEDRPLSETGFLERIEKTLEGMRTYLDREYVEELKAYLIGEYDKLSAFKITLAMLHGDFHCGNILVSADGRIGALDADLTHDPVFQDIAKFFADLETRGVQMLSQGNFLRSKNLARAYQAITTGYFGDNEFNKELLQLFIKVAILEKWLLDEINLMHASGAKSLARKALSGWRRAYFSRLLQEQLL